MAIKEFIKSNRGFIGFIVLMLLFRSAIADWNHVPSGSMKPTILEGDRIWINKLAYDFRIPLAGTSLITFADPERGDIVIFNSQSAGKRLVKRVVGLPGDIVAMRDNHIIVNNVVSDYELLDFNEAFTQMTEEIGDVAYRVRKDVAASPYANFNPVRVPEGHYLVLGDNRDNSSDSRMIGFVPREEIIGRTRHVVMSFNYDNYYIPRADRFFQRL